MSDKQPPDELIGQTIAGRYRIISRLGAGGMGVAYRAWDEEDGVPVVIKIPKKIFLEDPKFAERFAREIRLLQGLKHPHIVPIVDVGEHEGLPYVAMRFLPGGSLSNRRLRDENGKTRPNPPGMLHLWLPAVADALDHVHANGVVHRDVKPANIFFDAFWGAFLGDFGIAKIVEESDSFDRENTLTATNMGIGTQEYMGPEQFSPKPVLDGRTDQYALAVMVYEMVSGTRPFTGTTAHLIVEVTTLPVPRLDSQARGLPSSLVEAVHRGLAKDPGERFPTCREFAYHVLRDVPLLADEPDIARLLCPKCSNILKLPVKAAGQKGKCPRCQTTMKVAEDLGALWLLDEARRQRRAAASVVDLEDIEVDEEPAETGTGIDDAALEAFKPVSNTTPIEKEARKQSKKPSIGMILGGVAAVVVALAGLWLAFSGGGKKPVRELTYAQRLAQAEETFRRKTSDPAANDFLGRHWCFKQEDWKKGLPYLARSGVFGLWNTAQKELDLEAAKPSASPGDRFRLAEAWWNLVGQKGLIKPEETEAIKKHAAGIYTASVEGLTDPKDIEDANKWLDRDTEFRLLVDNKRPPEVKVATAEEILARPAITNSIGMKLKLIPPGTFMMGSEDGDADEKPVHEVRITKPFYIGVTEVTNAQWKAVMEADPPSRWKEDNRPVEQVSWNDAMEFCKKLSGMSDEKKAGRVYRLPTEAEWEYACRAGTMTRWSSGDDEANLGDFAWFRGNAGGRTHPVETKKPNPWGLHDMHGNVWERCADWYGPYPGEAVTDPEGPSSGSRRVARGGCWNDLAARCQSPPRGSDAPSDRRRFLGFRVALSSSGADQANEEPQPGESSGAATATASIPPLEPEGEAKPSATAAEILARPPLENSIGMKLKLIPPGTFMMGSEDGDPVEKPVHEVRITKPFYIGVYEVTNAQWKAVMGGEPPSKWKDDDRPVEQISWEQAKHFCRRLSMLPAEQSEGLTYRLPTEAEWEYCCRAGTSTRFSHGDDARLLTKYAWFGEGATGRTRPVGQKKPNSWMLFDMHGNVWEWCHDRFSQYPKKDHSVAVPETDAKPILRGGSWLIKQPFFCKSRYEQAGHLAFMLR
jgi:formylglycine-generating enzyme required for sulfatase activity/serine/threonine protein kinase